MSREVDDFFDETETKIPEDVSRLVERQMDIAEAIAVAIERSVFKTKQEFARAIEMKPSMLSRILAGNVNLTLKTITKIETALDEDIISVAHKKTVHDRQFEVVAERISPASGFVIVYSDSLFDIGKGIQQTGIISTNKLSENYPNVATA